MVFSFDSCHPFAGHYLDIGSGLTEMEEFVIYFFNFSSFKGVLIKQEDSGLETSVGAIA